MSTETLKQIIHQSIDVLNDFKTYLVNFENEINFAK